MTTLEKSLEETEALAEEIENAANEALNTTRAYWASRVRKIVASVALNKLIQLNN